MATVRCPRLEPQWRLLCFFAAAVAMLPFVAGRLLVPAIWASGLLRGPLSPCSLQALTGIPCPFCGGTRAVVLAAHGDWYKSLLLHPVGLLLVAGGLLVAGWLGAGALSGRDLAISGAWRLLVRTAHWRQLLLCLLVLWLSKLLISG